MDPRGIEPRSLACEASVLTVRLWIPHTSPSFLPLFHLSFFLSLPFPASPFHPSSLSLSLANTNNHSHQPPSPSPSPAPPPLSLSLSLSHSPPESHSRSQAVTTFTHRQSRPLLKADTARRLAPDAGRWMPRLNAGCTRSSPPSPSRSHTPQLDNSTIPQLLGSPESASPRVLDSASSESPLRTPRSRPS